MANEITSRTFTVRFKSGDIQPVIATSYHAEADALVFLNATKELVALFDLTEVADWSPKLPKTRTRSVRRASGFVVCWVCSAA